MQQTTTQSVLKSHPHGSYLDHSIVNFCNLGLAVIQAEAQAISELAHRIDKRFQRACELLLACPGRIVVTGMGKSGHIGKKLAATFSSTGSPAFFMHPGEASHGDLGMITSKDVVLAISYSGNTHELVTLLPLLKRLGVPLILLSGHEHSPLVRSADVFIDVSVSQEACPLGLAPTSSTTAALVMGDALAIALLEARGFSAEDFAFSHPGGSLGKKLLLRVDELCHINDNLPVVYDTTMVSEALIEVTEKKIGMTCVIDKLGHLLGVYTDGDVRRTLNKQYDIHQTAIKEVMTSPCKTITKGLLAVEALALMQKHSITSLVVMDENDKLYGVVCLHDILKAGVF
jgi:arabinose-5-phosphate isomerase